jgi:competence ComEA-like helix-hairpin-helix protein
LPESTNSLSQQADTLQNKIRAFAFCLALTAAILLSVYFAVSSTGGFEQSSRIRIEGRINPNYASKTSLARLPGIGNGRAEAIAAYRENFGGNKVFENCSDLQKVKGIGPKTAANICEWLKFE